MKLLDEGKPLVQAAVRAGMSEPTARKYARSGQMPSEVAVARTWRTRPDPFEEVWPEIEALLNQDGGLQAKTIFKELRKRYPGRFQVGQLRTLQRRVRRWKAYSGPKQEVYFPQIHQPGQVGQSDFTYANELAITIAGHPFAHLLYHFVLTCSNWESVMICPSESLESLRAGLQDALWKLGGVPSVHRTDNLSAATREEKKKPTEGSTQAHCLTEDTRQGSAQTHELKEERGRTFTKNYKKLLDHYGLKGTKNTPSRPNENGDVESGNGHLKNAIDQELRLRGSRDFASVSEYEAFLQACVASRNADREEMLAKERPYLKPLPHQALPDYTDEFATVSRNSTICVRKRHYTVHSRLIGCQLAVHLYVDKLELFYQGVQVDTLPRKMGKGKAHIDYRLIIHSLVRKPGAFRNYAFREYLFPQLEFRQAYDALVAYDDSCADFEYVRVLHLAAEDGEQAVVRVLEALRKQGLVPKYEAVRERVRGPRTPTVVPDIPITPPDLSIYDRLLVSYASPDEEEPS
jgi:hypothetical protein